MASFADWLEELPPQVRDHLRQAELTTAALITDSVSPQILKGENGTVITKPVDVVFLETIAESCDTVKPATAAWAKVRQFYERCYQASVAADQLAKAPEATPLEARDATAE